MMSKSAGIKIQNRTTMIVIIGSLIGVITMFMAWQLAVSQEEREKLAWQSRILSVLNGRGDVISKWVAQQKNTISELSDNPSLQLYFSNLNGDMGLEGAGQDALKEYLLPLLTDKAHQNGYNSGIRIGETAIKANVERVSRAGMALTNTEGQIVVATNNMPNVLDTVASYISAGANKEAFLIGPYVGEAGEPTISVITPVFGIDREENSPALGFLIGVRPLDEEFFDMLIQPGESSSTAKNYLVQMKGDMVHFIQKAHLADAGYQPDLIAGKLASGFAYSNPGRMAERMNYLGEDVLVAGTKIVGTDWSLVRTIGYEEALDGATERKRNILIISALLIAGVASLLVLIWRHAISVRLQDAIIKQQLLAKKHENLSKFMSIVTNSQASEITAIDEEGVYTFVNLQAAVSAGLKPEDMIGKEPYAVLGRAKVRYDDIHCADVLNEQQPISEIRQIGTDEVPRTIKTDYLPMLIGDDQSVHEKGVLMVKEDITSMEQNRHKRELSLKSLVSTLTMVIASRDPYSAAHAERVVLVTNMLSKELLIDETTAATAELAGAMMNLGKILVSRELLVKPTNLTEDELSVIRSSMLKSADLIEGIEFEGPVCETLRQIQAHWDGSGEPKGLAGEDILLSARIVAVANAFVGMTSARAHREGMDMKKVVQILMADADQIYDRRPVVALMNFLENKNGFEEWKAFGIPPKNIN